MNWILNFYATGCWLAALFPAISARTNVTITTSTARLVPNRLSKVLLSCIKFLYICCILQDWAKLGECKKNPDYMNIYCSKVAQHIVAQLASQYFTFPYRPKSPITLSTSHILRRRENISKNCEFLTSPVIFWTLQSCKKCSGGCDDENKSCSKWAAKVIVLFLLFYWDRLNNLHWAREPFHIANYYFYWSGSKSNAALIQNV